MAQAPICWPGNHRPGCAFAADSPRYLNYLYNELDRFRELHRATLANPAFRSLSAGLDSALALVYRHLAPLPEPPEPPEAELRALWGDR